MWPRYGRGIAAHFHDTCGQVLTAALCIRRLAVPADNGSTVEIECTQRCDEAAAKRDALSMQLYSGIFSWLFARLNRSISPAARAWADHVVKQIIIRLKGS